jgi:pimeloyl-ACP methyl ester carboxylesterase/predicted glycosyltransferase
VRALYPHTNGYATNRIDGVRLFYEVFGPADATRTILFLPTWTIVDSRMWKAQVPYFGRQGFRVVTFDNRGNGRSDRPSTGYSVERVAEDALSVLQAIGVGQVALVGLSAGGRWGVKLAAEYPERITHLVLIDASVTLGPPSDRLRRFFEPRDAYHGWDKYSADYWRQNYPDFLDFFAHQVHSEPHSTKQIEDFVGWGHGTTGEILIQTVAEGSCPEAADLCARIRCPTLIVHGGEDVVTPLAAGQALHAAIPGSELVVIEGGGHTPQARDPVRVNLLLHEFLGPARPPERRWRRAMTRKQKRALFVSSPIGLGHAQRDLAVADALRRLVPDLQIDWLAQDPVTRLLERHGERVHPRSAELAGEAAHIESECGEHDLHVFQAWRRMDEILLANFHTFLDAVQDTPYDLWIADEGWDIDYYLHENPELKRAPYVWLTDFVGWLPMHPEEEWLTADYNAEMLEQIARFPRVRDLALFVGNPPDIVPDRFGPQLPAIRAWTEAHYQFPGYLQYFDAAAYADRTALRARFGFEPGEPVVVASVGGTGVGRRLLERLIQAAPSVRRRVPGLRLIVVGGPRIDPASLPQAPGVEVRGYVPDLFEQLAACDLALVQGGLSTTMELVATGRPFLYFPLRHHFEQNRHVPHRLANYGVGAAARVDFAEATPELLAERINDSLRQAPEYRPVETSGSERAAQLIAELL